MISNDNRIIIVLLTTVFKDPIFGREDMWLI